MKAFHLLQSCNEARNLFGMTFRPVGLRKHIVDDVQAGRVQQFKCLLKQTILASPCVGKDEIEVFPTNRAQKVIGIGADDFQTRVRAQMPLDNGQQRLVVVDSGEMRLSVHAVEQPRGCQTGA